MIGHLLPSQTAPVLGFAEGAKPLCHLGLVGGLGPLEGDGHSLAGPRRHPQHAVRQLLHGAGLEVEAGQGPARRDDGADRVQHGEVLAGRPVHADEHPLAGLLLPDWTRREVALPESGCCGEGAALLPDSGRWCEVGALPDRGCCGEVAAADDFENPGHDFAGFGARVGGAVAESEQWCARHNFFCFLTTVRIGWGAKKRASC